MTTPDFQCTFNSTEPDPLTVIKFISPTEDLREWIHGNFDLSDFKLTVKARNTPGALTDLTYPLNDVQKRKLELYKFVYPSSGLMDWSECLVLIHGDDLVTAQTLNMGTFIMSQQYIMGDSTTTLNFQNMILAATIPLTELGEMQNSGRIGPTHPDDSMTLHLGLLVDERFFIANYSKSTAVTLSCGDWPDLIHGLLNDCFNVCLAPITYTIPEIPEISADYGHPSISSDLQEIGEYNAAQLLDACLTNCGLILTRFVNGNYKLQTYDKANQIELRTNYKSAADGGTNMTNGETNSSAASLDGYCLRAGGNWNRNTRNKWLGCLPNKCTFYFPRWDNTYKPSGSAFGPAPAYPPTGSSVADGSWAQQWDGDGIYHLRSELNAISYYEISVTKAVAFTINMLDMPSGSSYGQKVFRETARAIGSPPTNIAALTKLAKRLAADFYNRKYWSLWHETWNSIVPPSGSGWFVYTYQFNDLDCCTRIDGDFANHDVEQMMHDFCGSESSSEGSSSSPSSESESESSASESSESESEISAASSEESSESSEEGSSGSECYNPFPFVHLPKISDPEYILGVDVNGCWGLVSVGPCE